MRYAFADCRLDTGARTLLRGGREVHLEPQVFDLLAALAEAAPDLVGYEDLVARVWQGRAVSDATIAARISAARAAVGDDGRAQAVIRTRPRRGVQMAVPVERDGGVAAPPADKATGTVPELPPERIRYATAADGTAIAWAVGGEGPPLLRAGHWMSHLEADRESPVWRPFLARLGAGRRLVRYDPRGTGLSDREPGALDAGVLAGDLGAVADAAGLDRFPVFAASQSAAAALTFAADNPGRVTRIALLGGFARGEIARGLHAQTDALVAMIRAGWGTPGSALMEAMAGVFMPDAEAREVAELARLQAVSASPEVAARLREAIARIDVTGRLGEVRCPVLVLHAAGDAVQPVEEARWLAGRLPDAELSTLPTRNHVFAPSDPASWAGLEAAVAFLDGDPAGA